MQLNQRSMLTLAFLAFLVLVFRAPLAGETPTSGEDVADAAWCRSARAGLSAADTDTCIYRMERAENERERGDIREAFIAANSEKPDARSSGKSPPNASHAPVARPQP